MHMILLLLYVHMITNSDVSVQCCLCEKRFRFQLEIIHT